jgi:hypothetical protein
VLWIVDVGIAGVLLAFQPGKGSLAIDTNWLALATLGPIVGYLSELTLFRVALYAGGTLLVREIVMRAIWEWTVRRAAQLV